MNLYRIGFILVLFSFTAPAFAYLDPGTGSMWIQTIIALVAGFGVTLKIYWARFKQFLFRNKKDSPPAKNLEEHNTDTKI